MKPFDLDKVLNGAPVETIDGRPVTQLYLFENVSMNAHALAGILEGHIGTWRKDGRVYGNIQCDDDLVMAAKKYTVYINIVLNVYSENLDCYAYDSKEEAEHAATMSLSHEHRFVSVGSPVEVEE